MSPKKESYETMNQKALQAACKGSVSLQHAGGKWKTKKELVEKLKHADEKDAQGFVEREVPSDSSLRRLGPQWSRRTLSEGCSTPATPRMQGANRRSSGEALRQGRIGESPRNVGWPRAWTLRAGEPSRTQDRAHAASARNTRASGSTSASTSIERRYSDA